MEYPETRVVRWVDDETGEGCGSCEYIRKDKYDELLKAADELADAVEHGADQVVANALTVYRKATGDT